MTKRDLVLFTCRTLAIVLVLISIPILLVELRDLIKQFNRISMWMFFYNHFVNITGSILYLNAAFLLWFGGPRILYWLIDRPETADEECNLPAKDLCAILTAILGMSLIGYLITGLVPFLRIYYLSAQFTDSDLYTLTTIYTPPFIAGLFLIFRCRPIAEWILRKDGIQARREECEK